MTQITPLQAWERLRTFLTPVFLQEASEVFTQFHDKHKDLFLDMPASCTADKHHAFCGGYAVHIDEVVVNGFAISQALPTIEDYTRRDLISALYVHDLDKLLRRYERDTERPTEAQLKRARADGIKLSEHETKQSLSQRIDAHINGVTLTDRDICWHRARKDNPISDDSAMVLHLCHQHNLPLSDMALHAISVHHGGWSGLARLGGRLKIFPLGAIVHAADYISANAQNGRVAWSGITV